MCAKKIIIKKKILDDDSFMFNSQAIADFFLVFILSSGRIGEVMQTRDAVEGCITVKQFLKIIRQMKKGVVYLLLDRDRFY